MNSTLNSLTKRQAGIILSALFVIISGAFSLQFLGSGVPFGSDNSSHIAEIIYIAKLLKSGETNFWFDQNTLGYPLFLAYQPLPGLFMGGLIALTDKFISPVFLYKLSIALLWSFMPFAWYLGGRWFGMHRLTALILGVLSLSINDWEYFGLGVTSLAFNGLYTQSYGMLLLPLSTGSIYRFLMKSKPDLSCIKQPVLLFFLISTCHVFFGLYTAIISLLLIFLRRDQITWRAKALAYIFFISALLMAFWLIPFVSNMEYQGGLPWKYERENGFSLSTITSHLTKGDFFDWKRFPWFSLCLIFAFIINFRHIKKPLERWLLLSMAVTIFFFLGRTNIGKFYSFIPLHDELEVIRYMSGIHFCALLINALAISRIFIKIEAWFGYFKKKWSHIIVIALSALVLISIMVGRVQTILELFPTFDYKNHWFPKLAEYLNNRPSGRFLSHKDYGTDAPFFFNFLPVIADKPQVLSYARGYHDTLSVYYLETFPWLYRLYNIKTVLSLGPQPKGVESGILKFDKKIGAASAFVATDEFGYFEFVKTPIAIDGDLKSIREGSLKAVRKLYPFRLLPCISNNCGNIKTHLTGKQVMQNGFDLEKLSEVNEQKKGGFGSQILDEVVSLNAYHTSVNATGGDERLLLKVTFHPYWHAYVDDREVEIFHLAPNLMAIDLANGKHSIYFRYKNPAYQKLLFVLSGISILLWLILETAVGYVARLSKVLNIDIFSFKFMRRRSHPYGERKFERKNV